MFKEWNDGIERELLPILVGLLLILTFGGVWKEYFYQLFVKKEG